MKKLTLLLITILVVAMTSTLSTYSYELTNHYEFSYIHDDDDFPIDDDFSIDDDDYDGYPSASISNYIAPAIVLALLIAFYVTDKRDDKKQ